MRYGPDGQAGRQFILLKKMAYDPVRVFQALEEPAPVHQVGTAQAGTENSPRRRCGSEGE